MLDKQLIYKLLDNKIYNLDYDINDNNTGVSSNKEMKTLISALKLNKSLIKLNLYGKFYNKYQFITLHFLSIDYKLKSLTYNENFIERYCRIPFDKNLLIITNLKSILHNKIDICNLNLSLNNTDNKKDLITFLKNNKTIINLSLSINNNIDELCDIFNYNNIQSLSLTKYKENNSNLPYINIDKLAGSLQKNNILKNLYINEINIINVDKLFELLKFNNVLEILDLSNNNIINIDKLADSLKENKTLFSLYLNGNKINNIDKLIDSLKENKTLQILNLSSNNITKINVDELTEVLKNNNSLKFLDLTCNNIKDKYKDKLFKLKMLNPRLRIYY